MGNQSSQQEQKPKDDSHLYEYKKVGSIMVRVDKPQQSSFQDQTHSSYQNQDQLNKNYKNSGPFRNISDSKQQRELLEESEPRKPMNKLYIIQEETSSNRYQSSLTPIYTEIQGHRKNVRVYVDKDIEFNLDISNDQLTCGWMLTEVTKRYTDELNRIKKEKESKMAQMVSSHSMHSGVIQHSPTHKYTRKMIVTLKTTDQRESLDYWLTQYDRPLEVLEDGDFLIAHFVSNYFAAFKQYIELASNKRKEICKKDFEQIKVIGRGGFSRVILVRKKDTGRLYAMKIMKKNKIIREKKLKPILSERKILEKLKHPFIIKLHWAFQSNEELFFVMDLCTGGEIFFHLNRLKRFTEIQAKFYFSEILLGIEYLHNKNVVYRDIKPENILIDIDGHIRIADFGLSKLIAQRQKSYSFCGSPEYMSPEMLQGSGHDRKVDIYCLGALLFEMLTGLPPFYNKDTNKMYENILNYEVIFPDYISQQIQNLIQGMMQKDPSKRFQSIAEVKRHSWLKDVQWEEILHKRISPPIVPSVRDCHIDPDYIELPLDFEESQYKVRLSTERRYSYYYESTLQSKSATEQSFYNNFFEKNESGSGVVNLLGNGQGGSSVKSGVFNASTNPYGASMQSEQSQQSHDSNQLNNSKQPTKNVLTGLENFTFIDTPFDEIDVLRQIKKYSGQFEDKKLEDHMKNQFKHLSMQNVNQISPTDKNMKLFNKKLHPHHSINENRLEDLKYQNTFNYPLEESNKGNFTLSNKSGVTFEESNQSIAQEYRCNESIATVFGPGGNIIGSSILQSSGSGIINLKQTSILLCANNRLTIQEEEDDDLQSVGGSNYKNPHDQERDKGDNFSFKQQSQENLILNSFAPQSYLNDKTKSQNSKLNLCGNNYTAQMSTIGGLGQTMTTATQSSQYNNTHNNFLGATDNTISQYTEETPMTGRGCHTASNSKNAFQIPQFGRSGSQTNNIAKQPLQNPLFLHNSSVKNPGINPQQHLNCQLIDQSIVERDIEDQRSHLVLTPNYNKKHKKPEKKTEIKEEANKKSSINLKIYDSSIQKKTIKQIENCVGEEKFNQVLDEQEISFARIPSISGQRWQINTGGRESTNTNEKEPEAIQDGQSQQVKKSMHKHKPSYSLSPSNIIATSTILQQQQQKQQKLQQFNMKQTAQTAKKQTVQAVKPPQQSLNKHLNIVKKPAIANNPIQSSTSGIKSFLKAALPLSMQTIDNQLTYKTPEGTLNQMTPEEASDSSKMNQLSSSGKKNSSQTRGQKFRSMDMTQNLLKKSMGAKGVALKNNVAWKQHLLQIQTSQSPQKESTGLGLNGGFNQNNSIMANSQFATISIVDQTKQAQLQIGNQILQASPNYLNSSHLTIHNEVGIPAKFIQIRTDPRLIASKTPERKGSNTSQDSRSTVTYGQVAHKSNQRSIADKKRRSDGSQQSISSINQVQVKESNVQSQMSSHPSNMIKANIFSTPKGSKAPGNCTITPTNLGGYNSQRTVGMNAKPIKKTTGTVLPSNQMKTTNTGLSRNDLNQKKSNTAQAVLQKKIKNM